MKIRTGFISNSSSSSFLIYGVYEPKIPVNPIDVIKNITDIDEFKKKWEVWYKEMQEKYSDKPDWYPDVEFEDWLEESMKTDMQKFFEYDIKKFADNDSFGQLKCPNPFGDYQYVGVDPRNMDDNETMAQFKERVEKLLKSIFGDNIKCDWHEYAWRDG